MRPIVRTTLARVSLAAAVVALTASDASAAASTGYWKRFTDYWGNLFKQTNGISLVVIMVGLASLFIITRAKWRK